MVTGPCKGYTYRANPARIRQWDEKKGYHKIVDVTLHEVTCGNGDVVASSDNKQAMRALTGVLNNFPPEFAETVIKAIGKTAVSRCQRDERRRETVPAYDPNERHQFGRV